MPRFVLLRHETPPHFGRGSHWDLMLEWGDVLRTWALDELPGANAAILVEQLADHRLAYLEYEGAISGDRGTVSRVDEGTYEVVSDDAAGLVLRVRGATLTGQIALQPVQATEWLLTFTPQH